MLDAPLGRDGAKAELNRCIKSGQVVLTGHFREELANDDLTMEDVFYVCRSGAILMEPEADLKTGRWKYRIEGNTMEPRNIAVVFTFDVARAFLITVFERIR